MSFVLKAEHVDSFQPILRGHTKPTCAYKGCRRTSQVRVFYREEYEANQARASVCTLHALEIANFILHKYKFGQ